MTSIRVARRITASVLLLLALPLLKLPLPGSGRLQRGFCRAFLSCLGIRLRVSGGPVRNLRGMLVVSNHVSWVDVFAIGALLQGTFVARSDLVDWPAVGLAARLANVIPIDRRSLRTLPAVVGSVVDRLRDGSTVIGFPEGTTYCGQDSGQFRPALFQAAIDAARPVQPLRLSYHHADGKLSTATAFLGDDSMWVSVKRIAGVRRTIVVIRVRPLEWPNESRTRLSARCQSAVQSQIRPHPAIGYADHRQS